MSDQSFLGRGWSFPPLFVSPDRGPVTVAASQSIQQAIGQIIETQLGTRVMMPGLGSLAQRYVFESMDFDSVARLRDQVSSAVIEQEPRINVLAINVDTSFLNEGRVDIEIDYEIRDVNTRDNLVYPFYLQESV